MVALTMNRPLFKDYPKAGAEKLFDQAIQGHKARDTISSPISVSPRTITQQIKNRSQKLSKQQPDYRNVTYRAALPARTADGSGFDNSKFAGQLLSVKRRQPPQLQRDDSPVMNILNKGKKKVDELRDRDATSHLLDRPESVQSTSSDLVGKVDDDLWQMYSDSGIPDQPSTSKRKKKPLSTNTAKNAGTRPITAAQPARESKTRRKTTYTAEEAHEILNLDFSDVEDNPPTSGASSSTAAPQSDRRTRSTTRNGVGRAGETKKNPFAFDDYLFTYRSPLGSVPISDHDLACLRRGEFLNDSIIAFYIAYLYSDDAVLPPERRSQYHVFSSFFWTSLVNTPKKAAASHADADLSVPYSRRKAIKRHKQVEGYTLSRHKRINIFKADYIVIPVCAYMHWYLIVVFHPRYAHMDPPKQPQLPFILILDSLDSGSDGFSRTEEAKIVRDYLTLELRANPPTDIIVDPGFEFTLTNLPVCYPVVPLQQNGSDCGLFLMKYIEEIFKDPKEVVNLVNISMASAVPKKGRIAPVFMCNWFDADSLTKNKRREIKDVANRLAKAAEAERRLKTKAEENDLDDSGGVVLIE